MVLLLRYVVEFSGDLFARGETSQGSEVSKNLGLVPFSECSV